MRYTIALTLLQFHLVRNTLTGGKLIAYFIIGCIVAAAFVFACLLGWFFYLLGSGWLLEQPRSTTLLAMNGMLLVYVLGWFWGFAMEMQRSDVVDVRKMLYFPVPLPVINAINFLVSLVGFTTLFFSAATLGLVGGLVRSGGFYYLLALPAATLFYLVASAWAYYLRGLMAVWMINKRRRRILLSILPLFFMVAGFMPMILTNGLNHDHTGEDLFHWLNDPAQFTWIERASWLIPTGWLALSISSMIVGEGPIALPLVALVLLGIVGYILGYRMTRRYCYEPENNAVGAGMAATAGGRLPFTAKRLPLLNDDMAALVLATFLNFTRHPQMRTMLLAPFGMIILLLVMNSKVLITGQSLGMPVIVIMWPFFMLSAFFFNLFGMDSRGFRALMMLPVPRYRVLMAYHLALLPLAGGMGVVFALLGAWFFAMNPQTIVVALMQVLLLFLLFALAGTYVSILAPFAMGRNLMRGQKARPVILALLMPFVVAVLMLPTSLCLVADVMVSHLGLIAFPAGVVLSICFVSATLVAYPFILRHAGDLLLIREQRVLAALQKSADR